MGVLANVSEDLSEETDVVAAAIQTWFPTTIAAFTFLLFNLLDSPCLAAIATMAQQLQSRKWFWFAILYQNLFAYAVSLIVRWSGTWRSCIQRMDYRGSSPFGIHALHAVPSGSIQGSEELHKKLCRGSFIS